MELHRRIGHGDGAITWCLFVVPIETKLPLNMYIGWMNDYLMFRSAGDGVVIEDGGGSLF